jgi:hypothetical protein
MIKDCILRTNAYSVRFNLHSAGGGMVDYSIDFMVHPSLEVGNITFSSHRSTDLFIDVQVLADNLEEHITEFLDYGEVEESVAMIPYGNKYWIRHGSGKLITLETGETKYEFGLTFMVNVSQGGILFVGGIGTINVKQGQSFIKNLRSLLHDF